MDKIAQDLSRHWQNFRLSLSTTTQITHPAGGQAPLHRMQQLSTETRVETLTPPPAEINLFDIHQAKVDSLKTLHKDRPLLAIIALRNLAKQLTIEEQISNKDIKGILEEAKGLQDSPFQMLSFDTNILFIAPQIKDPLLKHQYCLNTLTELIPLRPLWVNSALNFYLRRKSLTKDLLPYLIKNPYLGARYVLKGMHSEQIHDFHALQSGQLHEESCLKHTCLFSFGKYADHVIKNCLSNKPIDDGYTKQAYLLPEEYSYKPLGKCYNNPQPVFPFAHLAKGIPAREESADKPARRGSPPDAILAAWWCKTVGDDFYHKTSRKDEEKELFKEKAAQCYKQAEALLESVCPETTQDPQAILKRIRVLEGLAYEYLLRGDKTEANRLLDQADILIINRLRSIKLEAAVKPAPAPEEEELEEIRPPTPKEKSFLTRSIQVIRNSFQKRPQATA